MNQWSANIILAVITGLSAVAGAVWALEQRFVDSTELGEVETAIQELRCEFVVTEIDDLRSEIYYNHRDDGFDRERWQRLQQDKLRVCRNASQEQYPNVRQGNS